MISNEEFMIAFVIIILLYSLRFRITTFLDDKFYIIIKPQWISYVMGVILFVTAIFGIFFNEGPGEVSRGFGSMEPASNKKPHKYFDINTYGDKKERAINE
jgi:hypothetical protein